MAMTQALAPSVAPSLSSNLVRVLSLPWLDRTIAAIACVPLVYGGYYRYTHSHQGACDCTGTQYFGFGDHHDDPPAP